MRILLQSRLLPDECVDRLRNELVVWSYPRNLFAWPERGSILGRVSDTTFDIVRYRRFIRNSFKPVASGRFTPSGSGTRIEATIGMSSFIVVFLGVMLLATCAVALATFTNPNDAPFGQGGLLAPLFPLGMLVAGRLMSRDDTEWLQRLLERLLEASPTLD
jgi:hypothetical protein